MKRIFIALPVNCDENLLQCLGQLKTKLANDTIKWVEEHNLHLTLRFIGEITEAKTTEIANILSNIKITSFPLTFTGIGIFGSRYNPRVIWLGIAPDKKLFDLEKTIGNHLEKVHIFKDRQNFVPHLTLGRINNINNMVLFNKTLMPFKKITISAQTAHNFLLMESVLTKKGPHYTVIQNYPLLIN